MPASWVNTDRELILAADRLAKQVQAQMEGDDSVSRAIKVTYLALQFLCSEYGDYVKLLEVVKDGQRLLKTIVATVGQA